MEVNFSGAVAAKMETGDFRALARVLPGCADLAPLPPQAKVRC